MASYLPPDYLKGEISLYRSTLVTLNSGKAKTSLMDFGARGIQYIRLDNSSSLRSEECCTHHFGIFYYIRDYSNRIFF